MFKVTERKEEKEIYLKESPRLKEEEEKREYKKITK